MIRYALPLALAASLAPADAGAPKDLNQFAASSYRAIAARGGNLIYSPISIESALSMLMTGARGRTKTEMAAVLNTSVSAELAAELAKSGNAGGNVLLQANALWLQRGFSILPAFQNALATGFSAPPTPVDFKSAAEQARAAINQWTSDKTKGRITDLFPPGSISSQTRLALTSAIYFNGKWGSPFLPKNTQSAEFHLNAKDTGTATFMNQTGSFGYAEVPGAQILDMRYAGGDLAFDAILPTATDGLAALENLFTADKFVSWFAALGGTEVQVALPKFRADAGFSLKQTLAQLGMPSAFNGSADFSGIDGKKDLVVSDVMHKAFVAVDEEGTEAAAATGIAIRATAMARRPDPKIFRADHPFAFFIRDTKSGVILFAGRVVKP